MSAPRGSIVRLPCAIALTAIACGLLHAAPARADVTPRADATRRAGSIHIGQSVDAAAFARLVETRYQIELRSVVAADVDRDGDLDVLASTDRELIVWMNDGAGRLTPQPPAAHRRSIAVEPPSDTWRTDDRVDRDTIQNDTPSLRIVFTGWHTPRCRVSTHAVPRIAGRSLGVSRGPLVPRAPPLAA
jgi:hypothetical protein